MAPSAPDEPAVDSAIAPELLAWGPDGLYFTDHPAFRGVLIRRLTPDGRIVTVAGPKDHECISFWRIWCDQNFFVGDEGSAFEADLERVSAIAIGPEGAVYILAWQHDGHLATIKVRRVGRDGIIRLVGKDPRGIEPEMGEYPVVGSMAVGGDGSVFYTVSSFVKVIRPDGGVKVVAGAAAGCTSCLPAPEVGGEAVPALQVRLRYVKSVSLGADGLVYFIAGDGQFQWHYVRQVDGAGLLRSIWKSSWNDNRGPNYFTRIVATPDGTIVGSPDGWDWYDEQGTRRSGPTLFRVSLAFPGISLGETTIPSSDGRQLYIFDGYGRHLRTLDRATGATVWSFGYTDGLLTTVSDRNGLATHIVREADGRATAIVAPSGQTTGLDIDPDTRTLSTITNPAGESRGFSYLANGLMTGETDARGNSHSFVYDAKGLLIEDHGPGGRSWLLSRTVGPGIEQVDVTSAEGRVTKYKSYEAAMGLGSEVTGPDGHSRVTVETGPEQTVTSYPDGTVLERRYAPDPRLGPAVPYASEMAQKLPSGCPFGKRA